MPTRTATKCVFDVNLCPLLAGLPPHEQQLRMQTDPVIRRCVEAVASGSFDPRGCKPARKAARTAARPRVDA